MLGYLIPKTENWKKQSIMRELLSENMKPNCLKDFRQLKKTFST